MSAPLFRPGSRTSSFPSVPQTNEDALFREYLEENGYDTYARCLFHEFRRAHHQLSITARSWACARTRSERSSSRRTSLWRTRSLRRMSRSMLDEGLGLCQCTYL